MTRVPPLSFIDKDVDSKYTTLLNRRIKRFISKKRLSAKELRFVRKLERFDMFLFSSLRYDLGPEFFARMTKNEMCHFCKKPVPLNL